MKCAQFENLLTDYLDGAIRLSRRSLCAEHLMRCRACRALVKDVQLTLDLCRRAGPVAPLADLTADIVRATSAGRVASCSVVDELILNYVDGFLTASDFHVFEAHFDICPRCRRLLTSVQLARALCQHVNTVEVPEGLSDRILDRTIGSDRRTLQWKRRGPIRTLAQKILFGARRLMNQGSMPRLATAALLSLATLGLLLVKLSDDMTLRGVYSQTRQQIEALIEGESRIEPGKRDVASNLREVKAQLSSVIEMSLGLFSIAPGLAVEDSAGSAPKPGRADGESPETRPDAHPDQFKGSPSPAPDMEPQ